MKGFKSIAQAPNNASNARGGCKRAPSPPSSNWNCGNHGIIVNAVSQVPPRSTSPSCPRAFFHTSPEFPDRKFVHNSAEASSASDGSFTSSPRGPLLLEGDSYHISHDGIARTLYRFKSSASVPFAVEECYNLKDAKKSFLLRREVSLWDCSTCRDGGNVSLGACFHQINLQEIEAGVYGTAGTGATTWESSILMSMYFASFPQFLLGDVIELGSGVGLGGMLCAMGPSILAPSGDNARTPRFPMQSLTLTDSNPLVLEQCRENLKALDEGSLSLSVCIAKLDWYDFLSKNFDPPTMGYRKYDTVIACDCAYRSPDLEALASTIKSLLRNRHSQAHVFGPSNRTGLEQLLSLLRDDHELRVTVENLEIERFRLAPNNGIHSISKDAIVECPYTTSRASSFLHIMCSPKSNGGDSLSRKKDLSDID